MSNQTESQNDWSDALKAYGTYPFQSDEMYQQGLASILSGGAIDSSSSPELREEITRRARVFYFNKITGHSITLEEARGYEQSSQPKVPESTTDSNDEIRVLTFAELKELIETGNVDKIPNNKIIPEGLNDAPPSESKAPLPKKPWEIATSSSQPHS